MHATAASIPLDYANHQDCVVFRIRETVGHMAYLIPESQMTKSIKADMVGSDYCQLLAFGKFSIAGMGSTCFVTMFMVPSRRETSPRIISSGSLMT